MKTDLVLQMRKRVIRSEFNGKRESERKPLSLKLKTPRRRKKRQIRLQCKRRNFAETIESRRNRGFETGKKRSGTQGKKTKEAIIMAWLTDNMGTIVVAAILAIIVALILRKMIRDRRAGRRSCSCGCEGCPGSATCGKRPGAERGSRSGAGNDSR